MWVRLGSERKAVRTREGTSGPSLSNIYGPEAFLMGPFVCDPNNIICALTTQIFQFNLHSTDQKQNWCGLMDVSKFWKKKEHLNSFFHF